MSDLESHDEVTEQIEKFGKDEVELKLGNTFSNTKDLSLDLSYRRLVFDNEDDYNKIDFSRPAEMELSHGEESFKVTFGGKVDDEINISLAGIRYENNKEGVDEEQCLLIYDENTHTWTLECIDYNYNVGPDGDYVSDILDDYERHFETSMKYEDDYERQFEKSMNDDAEEFEANAEDIEDEFIEGYNGNVENGIMNGMHDENGYEEGNSDFGLEDDAFEEVENPLQPHPPDVNEGIIKNYLSESSGTSSSGSSSSSASGSESGDEDGSDSSDSDLGSDGDLKDLEADLEAQLTEAPNNDIVKTNGVNRKTNPSTGRPEGPISLAVLFGGTGNENEDDESGSSSASD
ncbi:25163_t:CDS:2 [Gigaspora margarita]|uniref:25163_t:CDS:1 n=1 Tax=Gigaspora margarita TaxID=4874 RepID=A0ABN7VU12_GIGMA|nr:25163_t:CDS:2 [Gigaspora margarita]